MIVLINLWNHGHRIHRHARVLNFAWMVTGTSFCSKMKLHCSKDLSLCSAIQRFYRSKFGGTAMVKNAVFSTTRSRWRLSSPLETQNLISSAGSLILRSQSKKVLFAARSGLLMWLGGKNNWLFSAVYKNRKWTSFQLPRKRDTKDASSISEGIECKEVSL